MPPIEEPAAAKTHRLQRAEKSSIAPLFLGR